VETADANGKSRQELVVNGGGSGGSGDVTAYDPQTGRELWMVHGTTDVVCPTAIVGAGLVISTSGRNGPIIAIHPGGSGDVTQTNVVWKRSRGGAYVPSGVAYRNRLFLIADGGIASAFDLGNGEEIWQQRLKGMFTASLTAGAGKIYAVNEDGVVDVFAADDSFRHLATNDMQEHCLATPALVDGQLFIRTDSQLYCVGSPAELTSTR
jgi:outer membrane protein assembly factor BamB